MPTCTASAAPEIASVLSRGGFWTAALVTFPLRFEVEDRASRARLAVMGIKHSVEELQVVSSDHVLCQEVPPVTVRDLFDAIDKALRESLLAFLRRTTA